MAGGNETPRQKMIGMMYLVLTALLALNVSSAVLEKFAIIDFTLQELKSEYDQKNAGINSRIQESNSARAADAKVRAVAVRELTSKTLGELQKVSDDFRVDLANNKIPMDVLILDTHNAEEKMLDETNGKGKKFEEILSSYQKQLADVSKFPFVSKLAPLNKKAEDYENFKVEAPEMIEHHKEKDFVHFAFEGTPTYAAIAYVSQLQTEVLEMEATVLDSLARIADVGTMKVDQYAVMVIPESNLVVAGSKYKAKMFVAASSSGLVPTMKRNGADLQVANDSETGLKMADIEFTATATSFNEQNIAEQSYKAEITLKSPDTTLSRTIKYKVASPVIRATTGKNPTLYIGCRNPVTIDVPSLGASYNPTFTGGGFRVENGPTASQPFIIPLESKIRVNVSSGGFNIGNVTFETKAVPKPRVRYSGGSGAINVTAAPIGSMGVLNISLEPDPNFKAEVGPQDAVFRAVAFKVAWWRGSTMMGGGREKEGSMGTVNLSDWRQQFKPGDILEVRITKVTRAGADFPMPEDPGIIKLK